MCSPWIAGKFFNLKKIIMINYRKIYPLVNVEHFPPKIGNKANILLSLFNTVLACPIKQEKELQMRRVKNVLFTDRMIWLKYSLVLRHYSKLNYRFSSIPNTILVALFVERNKLFSILKWKSKGHRKRKEEPWRVKLEDSGYLISRHYEARIMQTMWYQYINKQTDQWKIMECPEIDPTKDVGFIFVKSAKATTPGI